MWHVACAKSRPHLPQPRTQKSHTPASATPRKAYALAFPLRPPETTPSCKPLALIHDGWAYACAHTLTHRPCLLVARRNPPRPQSTQARSSAHPPFPRRMCPHSLTATRATHGWPRVPPCYRHPRILARTLWGSPVLHVEKRHSLSCCRAPVGAHSTHTCGTRTGLASSSGVPEATRQTTEQKVETAHPPPVAHSIDSIAHSIAHSIHCPHPSPTACTGLSLGGCRHLGWLVGLVCQQEGALGPARLLLLPRARNLGRVEGANKLDRFVRGRVGLLHYEAAVLGEAADDRVGRLVVVLDSRDGADGLRRGLGGDEEERERNGVS
mmetsp:Transcript_8028/g.17954  ORF Transcript_8028/g.17954 Transcript_8028/m.17954 type:complete len:324 (+) Transcript_8028:248-1219(+)